MTQLRIQYPTPITGKLINIDCDVDFDDYHQISRVDASLEGSGVDIHELLDQDILDHLILTTLAKEAEQL